MTDDDIIDRVLKDEGGLVDNPADPGGITNRGITLPAFTEYLRANAGDPKRNATPAEIRELTEEVARNFYAWLLASSGIGKVQNLDVRYVVFDAAVNMGIRPGIRLLQRALGLKDDGIIGMATLTAVPYLDGSKLVRLILAEQMAFYGRLASGDMTDADRDGVPDRLEFLNGWLARLGRKMRTYA